MKDEAQKDPTGPQWKDFNDTVTEVLKRGMLNCGIDTKMMQDYFLSRKGKINQVAWTTVIQLLLRCLPRPAYYDVLNKFYLKVFDLATNIDSGNYGIEPLGEFELFLFKPKDLNLEMMLSGLKKMRVTVEIEPKIQLGNICDYNYNERPDEYVFGSHFTSTPQLLGERPCDALFEKVPTCNLTEYLILQAFYRYVTGGLLDKDSTTVLSSRIEGKDPEWNTIQATSAGRTIRITTAGTGCSGTSIGMRKTMILKNFDFRKAIREHLGR